MSRHFRFVAGGVTRRQPEAPLVRHREVRLTGKATAERHLAEVDPAVSSPIDDQQPSQLQALLQQHLAE